MPKNIMKGNEKQELQALTQGHNVQEQQQQLLQVQPYTHSVKITDTAKGIRIDVHVYANDSATSVNEALQTYLSTKKEAEKYGIIVAPIEIKDK